MTNETTKLDTGGNALPTPARAVAYNPQTDEAVETTFSCENGMTLLDHFAGLAMQGALADPQYNPDTHAEVADFAYDCAAAMVAEKRRREGGV